MPFLSIRTNQTPDPGIGRRLLTEASSLLARELGKPEQYVMVALEQRCDMLFAGTDAPLAYLELKSIGLPATRTAPLSKALAALLQTELGIAPERVYIEFSDASAPMWGWNGATF